MIIKRQKSFSKRATKLANKAIRKKLGYKKAKLSNDDPLRWYDGSSVFGEWDKKLRRDKFVSAKKAARDIERGKYHGNVAEIDSFGYVNTYEDPKALRYLHDHPNRPLSVRLERGKEEHKEIATELREHLKKRG